MAKVMSTEGQLPVLPVGLVMKAMQDHLVQLIRKNRPLRRFRGTMLWGPAGIGKSSIVYQLKDALEEETGKMVKITEIRLSMFTPMDLLGVPVASHTGSYYGSTAERLSPADEKRFSEWLCPRIFDLDPDEAVVNVIFLDELNAALPAVQAAAYQLVGDHRVGVHILPDNVVILAAGNRMSDNGVVYRMPGPLSNRLSHYEVVEDYDSWKVWAKKNRIDPRVIGYLSFARDKLNRGPADIEEKAFPTPRSWEAVSNVLSDLDPEDVLEVHNYIAANIGIGEAVAFEAWCAKGAKLPDVDAIFAGESAPFPRSLDGRYALVESMTRYLERKGSDEIRPEELEHGCRYAEQFAPDLQMMFYQNLSHIPGLNMKLIRCDSFVRWFRKNRKYFHVTGDFGEFPYDE